MEIIKEYIFKLIILLLISLFIIEIIILIVISKRASIIYEETYKETQEKAVQKAIEASQKLQELTNNYLSRFLGDLKLIGIHSLLFNINNTNDDNKLYNNNMTIRAATGDAIGAILNRFSKVGQKSHIKVYEEDFENITDATSLINGLMDNNKHPELNIIGYYDPDITKLPPPQRFNIEERINEIEKKSIKNIIPILKSIYIKRYIIKRANLDYIRFFILNKRKMFIFPPVPFQATHQYFFDTMNPSANCNEIDNPFPLCYYNFLNETFYSKENYTEPNKINFMTILIEKLLLQQLLVLFV